LSWREANAESGGGAAGNQWGSGEWGSLQLLMAGYWRQIQGRSQLNTAGGAKKISGGPNISHIFLNV